MECLFKGTVLLMTALTRCKIADGEIRFIIKPPLKLKRCVTGIIGLTSTEPALVCCTGESFEVTCNTTEQNLRWQVTYGEPAKTETRHMGYNSLASSGTPLVIDADSSTVITFSRISYQGVLPLVSRILIHNVSERVNGTLISCTEVGLNLPNPDTSETTLHVIGHDYAICR